MLSYFFLQLIASAGVNAVLSSLIIWITKFWISERLKQSIKHEYDQELEIHKAQLKAESDVEIERLKCQLSISANEHQIRFASLHERQADVIAETYSLLKQLFICLKNYTQPFRDEADELRDVDRKKASDALDLFASYYSKKLIFLPKGVACKLESIDKELTSVFTEFRVGVDQVQAAGGSAYSRWVAVIEKLYSKDITDALTDLETEFRNLIGNKI
jgi:hypothetical protein